MFVIALTALIGVIGALLWYTNWAEARILADRDHPTAETH